MRWWRHAKALVIVATALLGTTSYGQETSDAAAPRATVAPALLGTTSYGQETSDAAAPRATVAPALSASASVANGVAVNTSLTSFDAIANVPTLAPIGSAAPGSSTFRLVPNTACPDIVAEKINAIYSKNRAIVDECVSDADYQIFPHSGKHPTTKQIRAMATAPSCIAIFTAVIVPNFPACDVGGMPLKSMTETLLKIKVDIDEGREAASEQRFQELMYWRHDVNLAQAAGVPFDSDSTLYKEYKTNLWKALASSAVRVSSDLTLEYQLSNGTYTRGELSFATLQSGSSGSNTGSADSVVGKVRPASSSDSERSVDSAALNSSVIQVHVRSSAPGSLVQQQRASVPACTLAWIVAVFLAVVAAAC